MQNSFLYEELSFWSLDWDFCIWEKSYISHPNTESLSVQGASDSYYLELLPKMLACTVCHFARLQVLESNIHLITISVEWGQWDERTTLTSAINWNSGMRFSSDYTAERANMHIISVERSLLLCMCMYKNYYLQVSNVVLLCRLEYKAATQHCRGSTKIWRKRFTEM